MRTRIGVLALAAFSIALGGCAAQHVTSLETATADHSAAPLNWNGTYRGVLPCADCQGIETSITLDKNLNYFAQMKYLGRNTDPINRQGTFTWDASGTTIRLHGMPEGPDRYLVGGDALIQLDREGKRITGDLAAKYVLPRSAGVVAPAPASPQPGGPDSAGRDRP
jgi:uncharacterized lipoprotein NlpE involved in copper resistance